MNNLNQIKRRQRGISYLEVLVAAALLSISVVPISMSYQQSINATSIRSESAIQHFYLQEKLEEVLSQSYSNLLAEARGDTIITAFSDESSVSERRLVYIALWDADNADLDSNGLTGADDGLLWVKVTIENTAQEIAVLKSRP